jgi:hypothetical protein
MTVGPKVNLHPRKAAHQVQGLCLPGIFYFNGWNKEEELVMSYIFKGRLCGFICDECPEPLSDVTVRLYGNRKEQDVTALSVANATDTFAILNDDQVKAKSSSLIAEVKADANGNFAFELSDRSYQGQAFEVDVYCATVPNRKASRKPQSPVQFSITTIQPRWRQTETGFVAAWEYCIPVRYWCAVRRRFGAWTICGRVTVCGTRDSIAGVKVIAFDTDWIQDDQIGSATTDGSGKFRIDYLAEDFEKTPLSPLINFELIGGPDLYFRIETPGGTVLMAEPRTEGRTPGRQNVGNCFCVELCIDQPPPDDGNPIPLFTNVGQYRVDPIYNDFTSDGLTTVDNLAFTGTIPLIGILPNGSAPDALEYHFEVAQYDATGTVLGAVSDVDQSMIAPTIIGQLEYFDWDNITSAFVLRAANYWANNPSAPSTTIHRNGLSDITIVLNQIVGADGWIQVPRQSDLSPNGEGLFVGGASSIMVGLDTTKLTSESFDLTTPAPALQAGDSIPSGERSSVHRFKLFFEARKVGSAPIVSSNVLEKIVLSNTQYKQSHHPNWAGFSDTETAVVLVDTAEQALPGDGCKKVGDHVHALFTAYHPFLGTVSVYLEGPTVPPLPAAISPAIVGGQAVSPAGGYDFDITAQPNCAYILWLQLTLNLTSGYGRLPGNPNDHVAFCKG